MSGGSFSCSLAVQPKPPALVLAVGLTFEDVAQQVAVPGAAVAVLGEGLVVGHVAVEPEPENHL